MKQLEKIAATIDEAANCASPVSQFSKENTLSAEEAYAVQSLSLARRYQRGERHVGYKMGLTSRAKMMQVGVDDVIWGRLTDAMQIEDGGTTDFSRYIHPRAEPEIAFIMGKRLSGVVSIAEAMGAVEAICPAIEIIDSRYRDFKFALGDVVADNTSASGFILGPCSPADTDISNLGMVLEMDGQTLAVGSSAAILGHPARALVSAARMIAQWGLSLEPGEILLAGAATAAIPLKAGVSIRAAVHRLGDVSFQMAP